MVYVNGDLAGHWASGYTGFTVPLDTYLRYGAENEIRVECRAHQDSRWYAGAGIYRPVHLAMGGLVHIALDRVRVTTPDVDSERAVTEVETVIVAACARRTCRQAVSVCRLGAGGVLSALRTRRMVDALTGCPTLSSSPWILL